MKLLSCFAHSRPVRVAKFNREGDVLFSAGDDGKVFAWRSADGGLLGQYLVEKPPAVKSLDISFDTEYVAAVYITLGLVIYDVVSCAPVAQVQLKGLSKYVEFSYGNKEVLVLTEQGEKTKIHVFNLERLLKGETTPDYEIFEEQYKITQASWGYLNKTIYASTSNGKMIVFEAKTGAVKLEAKAHFEEIVSFSFSKDKLMLLTCSQDTTAKLFDAKTLREIKKFSHEGRIVRSGVISPLYDEPNEEKRKYHIVIAGGQDAKSVTTTATKEGGFEVRIINLIYGEEIATTTAHFGPVHYLSMTPDGSVFASGAEDGYVKLYYLPEDYFTRKYD